MRIYLASFYVGDGNMRDCSDAEDSGVATWFWWWWLGGLDLYITHSYKSMYAHVVILIGFIHVQIEHIRNTDH